MWQIGEPRGWLSHRVILIHPQMDEFKAHMQPFQIQISYKIIPSI
jgi:hypothetical protein